MRKPNRSKVAVVAAIATALALLVFSPIAYAGAPGNGTGPTTPLPGYTYNPPNPQWLAKKNAYELRSGVSWNEAKGAKTAPYFMSGPVPATSFPNSYELSTNNPVPGTFEPGDGTHPNYGPNTSYNDDLNHYYGSDLDFFGFCGPGAADNALYYWPNPPNLISNYYVQDPGHTSTSTSWTSERMRGYMTDLAWQIQWPGWPHAGMMDHSTYSTLGTSLYGMVDGLNWEASGRNSSDWQTYFYVIQWNGNMSGSNPVPASTFLADIESDTSFNNVPVVAEVNAQMMRNWNNNGGETYHFITIIGYDNNAGKYYYTDTCANSTGCGSKYDGGVQWDYQSNVYNAMINIPENQSTDPHHGDGGYVW